MEKCLTSLLQYGKVYAWLASTNHNQPRTVNRLFASPVRFLPITGCASVLRFALRLFSGLLIAFCPHRSLLRTVGDFLCEAQNRSITATGNRCRPFCGLYVGRGALTPRGASGTRPLQWRTANFPAMADVRGDLWAGRPTHSPQKGHPSRDYCNPVGAGHARPAA